jgi:hypothetical protein
MAGRASASFGMVPNIGPNPPGLPSTPLPCSTNRSYPHPEPGLQPPALPAPRFARPPPPDPPNPPDLPACTVPIAAGGPLGAHRPQSQMRTNLENPNMNLDHSNSRWSHPARRDPSWADQEQGKVRWERTGQCSTMAGKDRPALPNPLHYQIPTTCAKPSNERCSFAKRRQPALWFLNTPTRSMSPPQTALPRSNCSVCV